MGRRLHHSSSKGESFLQGDDKKFLEFLIKHVLPQYGGTFTEEEVLKSVIKSHSAQLPLSSKKLKSHISRLLTRFVNNDLLKLRIKNGTHLYIPTEKFFKIAWKDEDLKKLIQQFTLDAHLLPSLTLDELQDSLERLYKMTLPQLYAWLTQYQGLIDRIVSEVVLSIAKENPVNLLIEMLEDLAETHNQLVERYTLATSSSVKARLRELIDRIRSIIRAVFKHALQIPVGDEQGYPIVLNQHVIDKPMFYDRKMVENLLRKRIPDSTFIIPYDPNTEVDGFSGIDSTFRDLKPKITETLVLPETIINASVTVIAEGGKPPKVIFKPRPDIVAESQLFVLEQSGYLLTASEILSYNDYYIKRIHESNLQTIQFKAALDALDGNDPELRIIPTIIYLDGRIWPTEHKLDDYFAEHGKYTVRTLSQFSQLVSSVKSYPSSPKIVGVVKRGHIGYLWYIVQWYAYKHGVINQEEFLSYPKYYEGLESLDGVIAFKLLLSYLVRTRHHARTFAIRRKFYAMDDKLVSFFIQSVMRKNALDKLALLEDDPAFWDEVILRECARRVAEPSLRDKVDQMNVKQLSELVRRSEDIVIQRVRQHLPIVLAYGDVVIFYYLPYVVRTEYIDILRKLRAALPRIELLLPVKDLLARESGNSVDSIAQRIIEVIEEVLVEPSSWNSGFHVWYEAKEGTTWDLLIQAPVKLAHQYTKHVLFDVVAPQYLSLITQLVGQLLRQHRHGYEHKP